MYHTVFFVRANANGHSTYAPLRGMASHARYGKRQQRSFKLRTLGAHARRRAA